jgi:hypothetical protein
MNHYEIEEHNIPDRYLQGKLSAEERIRFEEHFIDCPECLARLEMTEDFSNTLRVVATQDAGRLRVPRGLGLRGWLLGLGGTRQAALVAAAILLIVSLPATLLIMKVGQSRREVDQARLSLADWQRRYEESQQAADNLRARAQELEKQLEQERQARLAVNGTAGGAGLASSAPIFDLTAVRSATPGQPARVPQISIPRSASWIVLKPEMEPDPELQSYRATLMTPDQQVICRASDLLTIRGALTISCDSSRIDAGVYRLTLEGLTEQGRYVSAGTFSFRVIKP